MDDGLDHKGQLVHDLHASTHHTSDANARWISSSWEKFTSSIPASRSRDEVELVVNAVVSVFTFDFLCGGCAP